MFLLEPKAGGGGCVVLFYWLNTLRHPSTKCIVTYCNREFKYEATSYKSCVLLENTFDGENWLEFSPSSTKAPRNKRVSVGNQTRVACAAGSGKELSKQLALLLFITSILIYPYFFYPTVNPTITWGEASIVVQREEKKKRVSAFAIILQFPMWRTPCSQPSNIEGHRWPLSRSR